MVCGGFSSGGGGRRGEAVRLLVRGQLASAKLELRAEVEHAQSNTVLHYNTGARFSRTTLQTTLDAKVPCNPSVSKRWMDFSLESLLAQRLFLHAQQYMPCPSGPTIKLI